MQAIIPLFDYIYHNPKLTPNDRNLMRAYHYKAQIFGWYSQGTDTTINTLHNIVGKPMSGGFPLAEVKKHFEGRGNETRLKKPHLKENRLRFILLNLIYVNKMGTSPFDVKLKGNEPHIDHIYPKSTLKTKLGFGTSDSNHIGNYRFVGALDNIRKRAELPASYFSRLKNDGIEIAPHLLVKEFSDSPNKLKFDAATYLDFRDRRFDEIWTICSGIVNPEK